jgi:hypothetical protein
MKGIRLVVRYTRGSATVGRRCGQAIDLLATLRLKSIAIALRCKHSDQAIRFRASSRDRGVERPKLGSSAVTILVARGNMLDERDVQTTELEDVDHGLGGTNGLVETSS